MLEVTIWLNFWNSLQIQRKGEVNQSQKSLWKLKQKQHLYMMDHSVEAG